MANDFIKDYIYDVCDILEIPVPTISYDTSEFLSGTTLAQCLPSKNIIYLRKCPKPNADQFIIIAHELRHIWQGIKNEDYYFSNFKPRNLCSSIEEYNSQIAEVDANAFATIIVEDFFGIRPLFNGLPGTIKSKIFKQAELIRHFYV